MDQSFFSFFLLWILQLKRLARKTGEEKKNIGERERHGWKYWHRSGYIWTTLCSLCTLNNFFGKRWFSDNKTYFGMNDKDTNEHLKTLQNSSLAIVLSWPLSQWITFTVSMKFTNFSYTGMGELIPVETSTTVPITSLFPQRKELLQNRAARQHSWKYSLVPSYLAPTTIKHIYHQLVSHSENNRISWVK